MHIAVTAWSGSNVGKAGIGVIDGIGVCVGRDVKVTVGVLVTVDVKVIVGVAVIVGVDVIVDVGVFVGVVVCEGVTVAVGIEAINEDAAALTDETNCAPISTKASRMPTALRESKDLLI